MRASTWRADFVHPQHPWRDYHRHLPLTGEVPPAAIRTPGVLIGLPAYDIYLLSDSEPWPISCTYTYTQSILGDLSEDGPPEYSIDLDRTVT
ncbi:hypothetical protein [Leifsonia sp. LS-T14]|uniref:hypothetical protein n=1 Tax=unclassified Leifsonia TaxID=2663824 RepID=UPI0035A639CB